MEIQETNKIETVEHKQNAVLFLNRVLQEVEVIGSLDKNISETRKKTNEIEKEILELQKKIRKKDEILEQAKIEKKKIENLVSLMKEENEKNRNKYIELLGYEL